jgi:hypothetical protein
MYHLSFCIYDVINGMFLLIKNIFIAATATGVDILQWALSPELFTA